MDRTKTKVCIVGVWHQGAVAAACLAELGYDVVGVDVDQQRIHNLNLGKAPLFEPGLDELLSKGLQAGHLSFTTAFADGLADTQNIMLMFDTPVDEDDEVDLRSVYAAARDLAPHILPDSLILVTAQVPVGTCNRIAEIIGKANPSARFGIAYSPENLRLGQAIDRFMHPQMPVIGADQSETLDRAEKLLSVVSPSWKRVNLRTAEMTKHALNCFLALSVCFANELGNLCDAVGSDGVQIAGALRLEPRIGPKAMLSPGLGFSGGTLARDLRILRTLGDRYDIETQLLDGAWQSNQQQNRSVVRRLQTEFGSLAGMNVGVLGLTYKPDTSTLRRSASIEIIGQLIEQGAHVKAYDPKADRRELRAHPEFKAYPDPYAVADQSDVLVLLTPWPEFVELDFTRIFSAMKRQVILDTQNMLDAGSLARIGFRYFGIGRGMARQDEGLIT